MMNDDEKYQICIAYKDIIILIDPIDTRSVDLADVATL